MKLKIFCRCSLFPSWSGYRLISTPVHFSIDMSTTLPDFRLPPRRKCDLRSFEILRSKDRQFLTDVSEPISPISRAKQSKENAFLIGCLTLEDGDRQFVPKRRQETTALCCVKSRKSADIMFATFFFNVR